ncbi:LacI family transcriptional regulator [Streptomyces albus subsp. chlorinus]|uniref:LacI family DNA-binding transcriptional regulator n=1 Tax=Streptomyces albus TaxID=1888 RepID=UPI001E196420|nr:LacI family transcriptional regulator [Streptomyces albus subsp. chlorinus]
MGGRTSKRKVTIRDVAERAEVSISTVSHTFSGLRPISRATRDRVLKAAAELGYEANPSARSLRTGRSGLVGLVLRPRFAVAHTRDRAETFNRLVGSVATEMLRRKVGLIHVPELDDPAVASVPMDGCIVAHPYGGDSVVTELLRRNVPLVTIEEDPERPELPWAVRLDYSTAVSGLLDHLREQGADRVTLFTGGEDNAWNRRTRETYHAWCERHGHRARTELLSESLSADSAATRIRRLLTVPRRPDAVVVATSDFAAIVVQIARELDLRVPEDLMVAALTDSEHSRLSTPPITAMDLSHEQLAAAGVELMLARLAGAATPDGPVVIGPDLRFRASTRRDGGAR